MTKGVGHRLAHIDAIRAIAALLVIVMHCCTSTAVMAGPPSTLTWTATTFDFGRIGIVLFFAVSGFVIPGSLQNRQHPATFWVRRFFRLYPVYWLSILLFLLAQWRLEQHFFNVADVAANATMLQNFLHHENLMGVYWTLKLELFFYLLCYLLFIAHLLHRTLLLQAISITLAIVFFCYLDYWSGPVGFARAWLHALGMTMAPGLSSHTVTGVAHPVPGLLNMNWGYFAGYFSVMFLGALSRRWYDGELTATERGLLFGLLSFWLVALPLLGLIAYRRHADVGLIGIFAPFPVALLLFLALAFKLRITAKSFAVMGLLSYSLYLMHPIVIDSLLFAARKTGWNGVPDAGLLSLVSIGMTLAVSFVCYRAVELPGIRLGRRLAAHLQNRHAQ